MARKASTSKSTPISAHPLFPAIVALWFAALFGVGSLILPAVLFERIAAGTGLASLWTGLQPPLAPVARIGIALLCAGFGVALGLFLARKVALATATPAAPKRRAVSADQQAKRPISAMEELGVQGLDEPIEDDGAPAPPAMAGRRRALSVTDESGPSEYLEMVPLPGGDSHAGTGEHAYDQVEDQEDTLELGSFEEQDDRGWSEENLRQSQAFGSGSLSVGGSHDDGGAGGLRNRSFIERQETAEDDQGRSFDAPAAAPAANPAAPFAPPPASAPAFGAPAAAAGARPFDAPPADGLPRFAAPPAHFAEPDVEDDEAEDHASPVDQLRRHFDAPEPQPSTFAAPAAQTAAFAAPAAAAAAERPRPAFGMPQPVDVAAAAAIPQAYDAPPAAHAPHPFSAPAAEPVEAAPIRAFDAPSAPQPVAYEPGSAPFVQSATQASGSIGGPLSNLGMVELVERFAQSLQRHAGTGSTAAVAAPAVQQDRAAPPFAAPEPRPFAAPPVEASDTPATPTVPPHMLPGAQPEPPAPSIPAALQPIGFEDEDDGEDDFHTEHPFQIQRAANPFAPPAGYAPEPYAVSDDGAGEDEDDGPAEAFGSLLAMKSPFAGGREFVRIEEEADPRREGVEPVVVFPGNEARRAAPAADGPSRDPATSPRFEKRIDTGATEQALRDALAKLQKMSGAA